ncbi:MAG: hypothetical protein U1A77_07980 [Pirellulales bacterium]
MSEWHEGDPQGKGRAVRPLAKQAGYVAVSHRESNSRSEWLS